MQTQGERIPQISWRFTCFLTLDRKDSNLKACILLAKNVNKEPLVLYILRLGAYLGDHEVEEGFCEVQDSEQGLCVGVADAEDYPSEKKIHARHGL